MGGTIIGDRNVVINGASTIEGGRPGTISFLSNLKYEEYIYNSEASAILVDNSFEPSYPVKAALIKVENVYESLARLLDKFNVTTEIERHISPKAHIDDKAVLGNNVGVGVFRLLKKMCALAIT